MLIVFVDVFLSFSIFIPLVVMDGKDKSLVIKARYIMTVKCSKQIASLIKVVTDGKDKSLVSSRDAEVKHYLEIS
jgi:hypothetical protein